MNLSIEQTNEKINQPKQNNHQQQNLTDLFLKDGKKRLETHRQGNKACCNGWEGGQQRLGLQR